MAHHNRFKLKSGHLPAVSIFLGVYFITACSFGYQQPSGHWQGIDAVNLVFSGVEIENDVKDKAYPDVCAEAQDEVKLALDKSLPAKVKPLTFNAASSAQADAAVTDADAKNSNAILNMVITHCELDSDQSGGSFSFYLTLTVKVSLRVDNKTVMAYTMETYEQAASSTPSPDFEFTFAEPKVRTLMLFDDGRVWVPDAAD